MSPRKILLLSGFVLTVGLGGTVRAAGISSGADDAQYLQKLEARVDNIVTPLELTDPAQRTRVHDALLAQYRAINDWHSAHDAELKSLAKAAAKGDAAARQKQDGIHASLQALHDAFLGRLAADLTPAQVEQVKDKMTYNKVKVTYDAYCQIVPHLTDAEKAHVLELLKQAREEAIDGGSAEEKSAVFGRYKGKINNYLSSTGHDVKKAYKDWGEKQSAKHAAKPEPDSPASAK